MGKCLTDKGKQMILTSGRARRDGRAETTYDNLILDYARDDYYPGCDVWGFAMSWQFAVAEHLTDLGAEVPVEWEYRQSVFGADTETSEYRAIEDATITLGNDEAVEYLLHAGRVFDHLNNVARLAGRSY